MGWNEWVAGWVGGRGMVEGGKGGWCCWVVGMAGWMGGWVAEMVRCLAVWMGGWKWFGVMVGV